MSFTSKRIRCGPRYSSSTPARRVFRTPHHLGACRDYVRRHVPQLWSTIVTRAARFWGVKKEKQTE